MNKEKVLIKAIKYRIKFNKDIYRILSVIQYDVFRIKNKATSMAWDWQQFSFGYNERFGEFPKEKDFLGKVLFTDIYQELRGMGENISSSTYNAAIKESVDKFKEQRLRITRGEESIANYKKTGSIPIRESQIKGIEKLNSKTYMCNMSLLSTKYVKELRIERNDKTIKTQFPITLMSGGSASSILDRIITGEYKLRDSRITMDRKNRFFLAVVYQFTPEVKDGLNKDNIIGIDIGVAVPAYLAVSNDGYYRQPVGDAKEIRNFQNQMESRKRALQRSRKWAGDGSVGHGTKTRIKPLEKLSGKIARYKEHKNHVWSRYIIEEAVKNDCGTIQMEDLTGIAVDSPFLKTWSYYQLQEMITYKAKEIGIDVVKVKPTYTSSRCNKCGNIHFKEDKNSWRDTQDRFKCMSCDWGHKFYVNADWNAALNISVFGIEDIIKEQLEVQKKHSIDVSEMQKEI
ncbi:transposase [Sporosarcina sp. FSL K6-1540]|uniref:RNA-guided endonuclease InsQ/TnpB family protein n=1 Tax=Sporosarcina sp. FSL K6-1540 TaxID=2921555 RepID=UPI00315A97BD